MMGCSKTPAEKAAKAEKVAAKLAAHDFVFVKKVNIPYMVDAFILKDKETGVLYLYVSRGGREGGITQYIEKEER